jgi:hypothetical protein
MKTRIQKTVEERRQEAEVRIQNEKQKRKSNISRPLPLRQAQDRLRVARVAEKRSESGKISRK